MGLTGGDGLRHALRPGGLIGIKGAVSGTFWPGLGIGILAIVFVFLLQSRDLRFEFAEYLLYFRRL